MRYDYFCPANQKTVEVSHSMTDSLSTWGEVCAKASIEPGETPLDSPVSRVITGGSLAIIKGEQGGHCNPGVDCRFNGDNCAMSAPSCCCAGSCGHKH